MKMENYLSVMNKRKTKHQGIIYEIECQEGTGTMTVYDILDGIQVVYNDFRCSTSPEMFSSRSQKYLEINHCLHGRFECHFEDDRYGYLSEGDLGINDWSLDRIISGFPLGYYEGLEVLIDVEKAACSPFLKSLHIDAEKLAQKVTANHKVFIMRSTPQIEHILMEMYQVDDDIFNDYLKIKVAELLLILQHLSFSDNQESRHYYTSQQIEAIKYVRQYLSEHLDNKVVLQELIKPYHISESVVRKCFKDVYGKPVYQWHKEYRLQTARKLLEESSYSIIEIASMVGYDNPSKFSSAFYQFFSKKPLAYRKEYRK